MGRPPSIDEKTGEALIAAYQRLGSVAAAAREVDVSESAARRYLDATPKAAAPVVAQQRVMIEAAGASLFDTRAALEENYRDLKVLIDQLKSGIVIQNGEYTTLTPPQTMVNAFKAALDYTTAAQKLYELMLKVEEIRKFQEGVLDAIGEADEATRQRIVAKLRERRAMGLIADFD